MSCTKQPNITVISDCPRGLISKVQYGTLCLSLHRSFDVWNAKQTEELLEDGRKTVNNSSKELTSNTILLDSELLDSHLGVI